MPFFIVIFLKELKFLDVLYFSQPKDERIQGTKCNFYNQQHFSFRSILT